MSSKSNLSSNQRIESIDALRAFALLGILLVHISQLYNFDNDFNNFSWFTSFDKYLQRLVLSVFSGRCRNIFCILFGVSFFLILRNPSYSTKMFCWRCTLLMGFGCINKLFFSTDILWWYGLNGIILALIPIRQLNTRYILLISFVLYTFSLIHIPNFIDFIYSNYNYKNRYLSSMSLHEYLHYPYLSVFKEQLHTFIGGKTETLSFFTLGYYLGKSGIIRRIDEIASYKYILFFFLLFALSRIWYQQSGYLQTPHALSELFGAFFYSLTFIFLFNKNKKWLSPVMYYGRLGLTNYSMQNILWPIFILLFIIPLHLSFKFILTIALLFYFIQILFSSWWTRRYKYGPLEYVWRIATQLKYVSNRKTN